MFIFIRRDILNELAIYIKSSSTLDIVTFNRKRDYYDSFDS